MTVPVLAWLDAAACVFWTGMAAHALLGRDCRTPPQRMLTALYVANAVGFLLGMVLAVLSR